MRHRKSARPRGEKAIGVRKRLLLAVALSLLASCHALRWPSSGLEVVHCRLASDGEHVGLRLRVADSERFDPDAVETYLIDESTGERFSVVRLQRIGRLAEFAVAGERNLHNILFRNREGKLRVGSRVTLVLGSARVKHLQVRE